MSINRKHFLDLSKASLLAGATQAPLLGADQSYLHHTPKAKRILQIICPGGASHVDLWDYKPELEKYHDKALPGEENFVSFQGKNGPLMKSPWGFTQKGECGKHFSNLLPHMSQHVDDMVFIHSMTSKSNTHGPGNVYMNTGETADGFPANGAWISYALGGLTTDLPSYAVVTDMRGEPPNGQANWTSGFLPAQHQGVVINAQSPIRNLELPPEISLQSEIDSRKFLQQINLKHARYREGNSQLAARMSAYDLAARMQSSAPEAGNLESEPNYIHQLYGTDSSNRFKKGYARNCLLSRRLLERGVRYVSLYCSSRASGVDGLLNWDCHKKLKPDYERHGPIFDQPTAALLSDLKQRGLLEDTLVIWTTEFGRMPTRQLGTGGRDHNPDGFTLWMMGAGVKGGTSYGATDPFGRRAEQDVTTVYDFYATVLHLMGINFRKLSYYYNGLDRKLTNVHGHVIRQLLST